MWGLLPRNFRLSLIVSVAIVGSMGISGIVGVITGDARPAYQYVSAVVFLFTVLTVTAERIWRPLWRRFPILGKYWFPDLNGTWMGTLDSSWKANPTDPALPPIPVTLQIKQGLFDITVRGKTGESSWNSLRCFVEADKSARVFRLSYIYHNHPEATLVARSQRHDGTACLEIEMNEPLIMLKGRYYTERRTAGDFTLTRSSIST